MKTYLIREHGDNSGALVGSAVVFDARDLWLTMDEFANPHEYEYLRIRGTCFFCNVGYGWQQNEAVHIQVPHTDEEREEFGDDEPGMGKWKTIVDLCGGQEKFDKMYTDIYGCHNV